MLIYKNTSTLDNYLSSLQYTENKEKAEIMLVGGKQFDLDEFPQLRGVFKTGVGTDNLPFSKAEQKGVKIGLPSENTREIIYEETAAFSCHLILAGLYTNVSNWENWTKFSRKQLAKQRLLVIGAGRIGKRVMNKMDLFMIVDSFDITINKPEMLEPKLREADCVSIHVPLTADTRNLLNIERLSWLKDGALVVNTARGPIIDEEALYQECAKNRLRAAIDVFWEEPYSGHLNNLSSDRFIRTPHIASTCKDFLYSTAKDFMSFLIEFE